MGRKLEAYRAKRDFQATPEPPPEAPRPRADGPLFMVHKHDATRLHYDLRLELDGALASWAIPRGPSYDPRDKRLAVQTEDHPLAYAEFEGRIPDEEYGGGDSLVWDRGTWRTEPPGQARRMREKGHLVVRLEGRKLRGLWHLVRTRPAAGKQQWLFFKANDEFAHEGGDLVAERPESVVSGRRLTRGPVSEKTLRARHPSPLELLVRVWPPERATLSAPARLGAGPWAFEVKYDGWRALAGVSGRTVSLQSRQGLDLSRQFPDLVQALVGLRVGEAVLDGEIVATSARGSPFEALRSRRAQPVFVAFDLLWLEGEDLRGRPLEDRRDLLESLLSNAGPALVLAERLAGPTERAIAESVRRGLEGVVAKRAGSPYRGGPSRDWRKLVNRRRQDAAVAGYLPPPAGTKEIGALLLCVREGEGWRWAGAAGTGLSEAQRRELRAALDEAPEAPPPGGAPRLRDARWREPRLVVEVDYREWSNGGELRHPVVRRLRPDKSAAECVREDGGPETEAAPGARAKKRAAAPRKPAPAPRVPARRRRTGRPATE